MTMIRLLIGMIFYLALLVWALVLFAAWKGIWPVLFVVPMLVVITAVIIDRAREDWNDRD